MNEIRFNDFIKELKNTDYELIKQLGELLISEEKKIENLKTSASSNIDLTISITTLHYTVSPKSLRNCLITSSRFLAVS